MNGGNNTSTRGSNLAYRGVQVDESVCGTTVMVAGKPVKVEESMRIAGGSIAVAIFPKNRKGGKKTTTKSGNVLTTGTVLQGMSAVRSALGLPDNVSGEKLIAALKSNARVVGIYPEDANHHLPTAAVRSGTMTVRADMDRSDRMSVTVGQRLYATCDSSNVADGWKLTTRPPTSSSHEFSDATSQLYAHQVGTPEQNAAVAYISEGIRRGMRFCVAHVQKNGTMPLNYLAEIILSECGLPLWTNRIMWQEKEREAREFNALVAASRFPDLFTVRPANYGAPPVANTQHSVPVRVPIENAIDDLPSSTNGVFSSQNMPAKDWIGNVISHHVVVTPAFNNYEGAVAGGRYLRVVRDVFDVTSIEMADNAAPGRVKSFSIDGVPENVELEGLAQAALRVIECSFNAVISSSMPDTSSDICGTNVEHLIALAKIASLAPNNIEFGRRSDQFRDAALNYGCIGTIQDELRRHGISEVDCGVTNWVNAVPGFPAMDRRHFALIAKTLEHKVGMVRNGCDAFRIIGTHQNLAFLLGETIASSLLQAVEGFYVGTYAGADSGIIVNLKVN